MTDDFLVPCQKNYPACLHTAQAGGFAVKRSLCACEIARTGNSALFNAAPEMLAALYQIAQGGNVVRTDWPASKSLDRESMCDIARAAIAKATGG